MTSMDSAFLDIVRQAVPGATLELAPSRDMVTVFVERDYLVDVCRTLRDHADLQFALLADITAVDLLPASPRFEIVYNLACLGPAYGTAPARRLRVKVRLMGDDPRVPTVCEIWPAANWAEREVFDLFGVDFIGLASRLPPFRLFSLKTPRSPACGGRGSRRGCCPSR